MLIAHSQPDTTGHIEMTANRKQAQHCAHGLNAAVGIFQTGIHHRRGAGGGSNAPGQLVNFFRRHAGNFFSNRRREMLHIARQLIKAKPPLINKFMIIAIFIDQYACHRQGQCAVSSRTNGDPFRLGASGGLRIAWIDNNNLAAPFRRRFQTMHVQRRRIRCRVCSPDK